MKIAIIGASTGQLPLCLKSKECGLETICFAWPDGAICRDAVDKFYPISILEKEKIVDICKKEGVDGVVSNGSDLTAEIVSYVSCKLGLHGIKYDSFLNLKNKNSVRRLTNSIPELSHVFVYEYYKEGNVSFPCIVKPQIGASKKGVYYVASEDDLDSIIVESKKESGCKIMIEEFVPGHEISVETISYEGKHYVIQITDKENSGAPHFVELSHHQPSQISAELRCKIERIVPNLLNAVDLDNGASHIEMKVTDNNDVYLIEINPRGGGDEISNKLVMLSTGYDYLRAMIEVAIGRFSKPIIHEHKYAGIYYLCSQRSGRLKYFVDSIEEPWLIERQYDLTNGLNESMGNYDRNGYLIYQSDSKVEID